MAKRQTKFRRMKYFVKKIYFVVLFLLHISLLFFSRIFCLEYFNKCPPLRGLSSGTLWDRFNHSDEYNFQIFCVIHFWLGVRNGRTTEGIEQVFHDLDYCAWELLRQSFILIKNSKNSKNPTLIPCNEETFHVNSIHAAVAKLVSNASTNCIWWPLWQVSNVRGPHISPGRWTTFSLNKTRCDTLLVHGWTLPFAEKYLQVQNTLYQQQQPLQRHEMRTWMRPAR